LVPNGISDVELVATLDDDQIAIGARQRRQLAYLAECDRRAVWKSSGAKDMAGWVSARYGVSPYRSRRMVNAGYALESLPLTAEALETGRLNLDRVVELVRLATRETESDLVEWARRVTPQWIGHKADLNERQRTRENRTKDGARYLDWWWGPDATLRFEGLLPNDAGMKFVRSLEHLADQMPISPDPKDETTLSQRRADALLAMATDSTASGERDAATVVAYAPLEVLLGKNLGGELEDGQIIHADVVRRLVCDGRIELVCHDSDSKVCRIGSETYKVPRHIRRQVMRRDGHRCTFPGCHSKRYIDSHHIVPWPSGATELDNLTCLCRHHHKLVHEHGWRVRLTKDDRTEWFRPDGRRFDPGPIPRAGPPRTIQQSFATYLELPGVLEDSLDWRRSHAYREAA
jgi:5-methylcytosine-specific restriction endonuclease McrA